MADFDEYKIYPANLFMTTKESTLRAIHQIEDDLTKQVAFFEESGKFLEAKRIYERVTYDMEMIRELGHCSGIENYSRYFDGREAGTRPYCLLDFFPKDFLLVIDFSKRLSPGYRRKSCQCSANQGYVWRRQGKKEKPGGIRFPTSCSHG